MDGPVPRAAFGVSRVPLTCTALYYFIGTMHCTAVKAMSLQGRRPPRAPAVAPSPRSCHRGGAHGLKKENLTRALLLFGLCSVSFSSQFSLHGPESVKVRKLGIKQKYLVNHMICILVLYSNIFSTYTCYIL